MIRNLLVLVSLCVFLTVGITASAGEGKEGKKKPKPEKKKEDASKAEEMTLTGKIEKKGNNFTLVCADGSNVRLPAIPKGNDDEAALKYDDFVGKDVTVVGMGMKHTVKDKEMVMLKSVKSITPAGAEGAAPPAAEEGAAPPAVEEGAAPPEAEEGAAPPEAEEGAVPPGAEEEAGGEE